MERADTLIDLGTASIETKGPGGIAGDVGLNQELTGLSDD
ncbi:benenodin family lasso peptide [Sphingobium sp. YR768]|nr:benenodin family lasso peptide [Sphingobium sp. YR768]SER83011.1 hypothetical protein SAMN05518866_12066 [Sphingobium sp. YR768]